MRKLVVILFILLVSCIRPPDITGAAIVDVDVDNGEVVEQFSEYDGSLPVKEVVVTPKTEIDEPAVVLPKEANDYRINLTGRDITPRNLTVARGSSVYWVNYARVPKQIMSADFNSAILRPGQSYAHQFNERGIYSYHLEGNTNVWGIIRVIEPVDGYARIVKLTEMAYIPQNVTIKVGETVRWRNDDTTSHTVTGAGFDSQSLRAGGTFEHTFNRVGKFPYGDTYQNHLIGIVTVER